MKYAATIRRTRACGSTFYRLTLAHWNRQGRNPKTGEAIQSFAPRFVIKERGDFVEYAKAEAKREEFSGSFKFLGIAPGEIDWY
jgi:hypothetical protein